MDKIVEGVFIEDQYPGVVVGAVPMGDGVLLIDAPLRPEDGRSWLATLRGLKGGADRLLVYLDSHTDRTLGGRVLESTIIAHEDVYQEFENRPSVFKALIPETGTAWETCTGLSGIRWLAPHLAFSKTAQLQWKDKDILLEHHPGPEDGASWVCLPEEKVLFIGDLVTVSQPPFLSGANLEEWGESLDLLHQEYKSYIKIASRDGVITDKHIKAMAKFISGVHKRFVRMARRKSKPKNVEKYVEKYLEDFDYEPRYHNHYYQRLQHGLLECYSNRYLNPKNDQEKE
jgi:cyclase